MKSLIAALFVILQLHGSSALAAPTAAFAATAAVGGIIDQLKTSISELLDQLDNRVSARSFQLRTELVFLQAELGHTAGALAGKTFGELTKQQQIFFEGVSNTISQGNAALADATGDLGVFATHVEHLTAQFPFTRSEPRVRRSTPTFLRRPASTVGEVPITIDGSFLNHGSVEMAIGKTPCRNDGQTDSRAVFSCPASVFASTGTNVSFASAAFSVDVEMSFFQSVASYVGLGPAPKTYLIPIAVVPPVLGTYSVSATYMVDEPESKTRSGEWGRANDHCVGRQAFTYNFSPAGPGWRVDIGSIGTQETCGRGNQGHAVRNASEAGFQVESWASNSGRCERVFGSVVSRDARGCSAGRVTWRESRTAEKRVESAVGSGALEWGRSVTISLPDRIVGILVTVEQLDGQRVVLNSATSSKWFSLSRDAASTSLVISPRELSAALSAP